MSEDARQPSIEVIDSEDRRAFIAKAMAAMAATAAFSGAACAAGPEPEAAKAGNAPLHPVRLDRKYMDGKDIPELAPWPAAMQLRPVKTHRTIQWYTGEKLSCMVYDADDGLLKFTNLPYDEHVVVLNGTATLTSLDGRVEVFNKGDVFIAPKGWNGTWQLANGYRELICFETKSLDDAMKAWFE
ncbi:MAG: cupin domain-containing protein [Novosphingobium sp.]|uniref:cupin domain-containing protein n=1 Tax=Novosphingobium sp. TaxID=1874826 RepID=UPI002736CE3A|nr:cupin domain-containing protein [Novosphingobium sp.]MDP3550506.1 cupin domain-containing protein [Novosphingobium sp.]